MAVAVCADLGLGPHRRLRVFTRPHLDDIGMGGDPLGQRDCDGQPRHRIQIAVLIDQQPHVGDTQGASGETVRGLRPRRPLRHPEQQLPQSAQPDAGSIRQGVEVRAHVVDGLAARTCTADGVGGRDNRFVSR